MKDYEPVQLIDPDKLIAAMELAIHEMVQVLLTGPQLPKLYVYQKTAIKIAIEQLNESMNELLKQQHEKLGQLVKDLS